MIEKGMPLAINVVISKFNISQIVDILVFCLRNIIPVKFFSLLDVIYFGNQEKRGNVISNPVMSITEFEKALEKASLGSEIARKAVNGGVDIEYEIDGVKIKYCQYLCKAGMCHVTGTRIDADGYVYNCIERQGVQRIDVMEGISVSASKIKKALEERCTPR